MTELPETELDSMRAGVRTMQEKLDQVKTPYVPLGLRTMLQLSVSFAERTVDLFEDVEEIRRRLAAAEGAIDLYDQVQSLERRLTLLDGGRPDAGRTAAQPPRLSGTTGDVGEAECHGSA